MANLEKLVEQLGKLTVLEAAELTKLLEEEWGVSAAAPVATVAATAGAGAARHCASRSIGETTHRSGEGSCCAPHLSVPGELRLRPSP